MKSSKPQIIVICGATASGKTHFAEILATKLNTEIISADSMQIYRYMDIGTAKEKNLLVKQHMIDIINPDEPFNVYLYQKKVEEIIQKQFSQKEYIVFCGGTGLYIDSIYYEKNYGGNNVQDDEELKENLDKELNLHGKEYIFKKLEKLDPISAKKLHPNNTRRVLRALYLVSLHKKPISEINKKSLKNNVKMIYLNCDKQILDHRVASRVDTMLNKGLEKEVLYLTQEKGYSFDLQSLQGIGYKEWELFFEGTYDFDTVRKEIIKNTLAYAKRQRTWFNNQYKINKYNINNYLNNEENIIDNIIKTIL